MWSQERLNALTLPLCENYQTETGLNLAPGESNTNGLNMEPLEALSDLIERASKVAGSQRKLAALLEMNPSNLIEMKQGKRLCNWRVRGKLRAILGEDPTHAFMAAMADELSNSENEDEKKAASGLNAMLAAFPEGWRKRRDSNPR